MKHALSSPSAQTLVYYSWLSKEFLLAFFFLKIKKISLLLLIQCYGAMPTSMLT
jgi:hypothetical protein